VDDAELHANTHVTIVADLDAYAALLVAVGHFDATYEGEDKAELKAAISTMQSTVS